jgi:hypothetical protein
MGVERGLVFGMFVAGNVAEFKRRACLVKRDQGLPSIGGEGVAVELFGHAQDHFQKG